MATCTDTPGWTDADGFTCSQYESCKNGGWKTKDANYYAKWARNGVDARQACCECGKGASEIAGCQDLPHWKNVNGFDCKAYANTFAACDRFGNVGDQNGVTANTACCVCKPDALTDMRESMDSLMLQSFMNRERFKNKDPQCLTGVKFYKTCCYHTCGECNPTGCSERNGGSPRCCPNDIVRSCEDNPPPCVMGEAVVTVPVPTTTTVVKSAMAMHAPFALLESGLLFAVGLLLY